MKSARGQFRSACDDALARAKSDTIASTVSKNRAIINEAISHSNERSHAAAKAIAADLGQLKNFELPPASAAQEYAKPRELGTRSGITRITQRGEPGYQDLVDVEHEIRAAVSSITPDSPFAPEQASYLAMADIATDSADFAFAQGDLFVGRSILDGVQEMVSDTWNYAKVRDTVTAGSTFLGGIINGATGLPGAPFREYQRYWAVGQLVGSGLGLAGDIVAMATGISSMMGGGGLAVASVGTLAPIGAAMAGEGAVIAAAGAAGSGAHIGKMKEAWDKLTDPPRGSGVPGGQRPAKTRTGATRAPANEGRWTGERAKFRLALHQARGARTHQRRTDPFHRWISEV